VGLFVYHDFLPILTSLGGFKTFIFVSFPSLNLSSSAVNSSFLNKKFQLIFMSLYFKYSSSHT